MLASWLFCQFMLTNEVQIAYSQTEGYCPVTTKAQESETYTDYLSRAGEDNDLYYDIKLAATELLRENTGNTFVTPVFNGSASLRNAAGDLIESVNKAVRRKEKVDAPYLRALEQEITARHRLDQISAARGKIPMGKLPAGSVILISCIGICWVGILAYVIREKMREQRSKSK